ncbi:MAG: phage BR0599 family protein [Pseudomonadota bacterium]
MTYVLQDESARAGDPIFLYEIDSGGTRYLRAAGPVDVTLTPSDTFLQPPDFTTSDPSTRTYVAEPGIAHTEILSSGEVDRAEVQISFPISSAFAISLLGASSPTTWVTIFRYHLSDVTSERRALFVGRLISREINGYQLNCRFENIVSRLRANGLREYFSTSCRHALYQQGCNLNIEDFFTAGTATALSDLDLTVTEAALQADGYYTGGVIRWNSVLVYVLGHTGSTLLLKSVPNGLAAAIAGGSQSVEIAPGCPLSIDVCGSRFNNADNFGGFPYIPKKNPYDGTPIDSDGSDARFISTVEREVN